MGGQPVCVLGRAGVDLNDGLAVVGAAVAANDEANGAGLDVADCFDLVRHLLRLRFVETNMRLIHTSVNRKNALGTYLSCRGCRAVAKRKRRRDDPTGARGIEMLKTLYCKAESFTRGNFASRRESYNLLCLLGGSRQQVVIKVLKRRSSTGLVPPAPINPAHESQAVTGSQAESDSCGGSFPDKGFNRSKPDAR